MSLKFHLVVLGPQASGKGTQARLLSEKFKAPYFSAGELIRKKAQEKNKEAQKIKILHDQGFLIPHQLVKKLIEKEFSKIPQNQAAIFEGYPRTLEQVKDFEDILKKRKLQKKKIIVLKVSGQTSYKRISGRRVCQECEKNYYPPFSLTAKNCSECKGKLVKRADDTEEAIKKRLATYDKETKPVLEYFGKRGELLEIDGEPAIETVFQKIVKELGVFDD